MKLIYGQWTFRNPSPGALPFPLFRGAAAEDTTIYSDQNLFFAATGFTQVPLSVDRSGTNGTDDKSLLLWNGRLDNRQELCGTLGIRASTDKETLAAAYRKWNTDAFRRIIGDWSLIIWDAVAQSLILTKDPVGTRPLFYSLDPDRLVWSSSLGWLVQNGRLSLGLSTEYLAGWLALFPSASLTPYAAIRSVPPSSFVRFGSGRAPTIHSYSQIEPSDVYLTADEHECEEIFRSLFANSVRRRLRSSEPVLADLSGGMDSSSIVCVADALLRHEADLAPRLDTVSYYDDDEPNWNERAYFSLVEQKRGRCGLHVPVDSAYYTAALFEGQELAVVPAELGKTAPREQAVRAFIASEGHSTILCGVGGDEFTGGVPTPVPELADLLAAGAFRELFRQLTQWALSQKRPIAHVALDTVRAFVPKTRTVPPWLMPDFRRRFAFAFNGYEMPLTLRGSRPSFQENLHALSAIQRQLAVSHVGSGGPAEKCYPYLDGDLLQFLFNVPRVQLVQPGRRRSLMRRSLAGIVPDEILHRKRKAFVNRAPRTAIASHWKHVESLTRGMVAESLGMVTSGAFRQALEEIRSGKDVPLVPVQRMLVLECWLRNISAHGLRPSPKPTTEVPVSQKMRPAHGGGLKQVSVD